MCANYLSLIILLGAIFSGTIGSTPERDAELSVEDSIIYLKERMTDFSLKLQELQQWTLDQKDEVLKKVTEVERKCEESTADVAVKLENAENRFLKIDTHLLMEVQQIKTKTFEALETVSNVKHDVTTALERERLQTENLQDKVNGMASLLNSADIKNMSSLVENMRLEVNSNLTLGFQKIQSNFTTKMRTIENSILKFEKDYGNPSYISGAEKSFENQDKSPKTVFRTTENDLSSRVNQLEQKIALCDGVQEMNNTLRNHTSQINGMNQQLFEVKNSCSYPPRIQNGYPLTGERLYPDRKHGAVVVYGCRGSRTLVGGEITCILGNWTGILPDCMENCNTKDLKVYDGLIVPSNRIIEHSGFLDDFRCGRGYEKSSTSKPITCYNGTWIMGEDPCIEESCSTEPPSVRNGKPMNFDRKPGSVVRYECDRNFIMTRNSSVRCTFGKWEGQPSSCSFFDATFTLVTDRSKNSFICYSDDYYQKIKFSRMLGSQSGGGLPWDVTTTVRDKAVVLNFSNVRSGEMFGAYECGIQVNGSSVGIVSRWQTYAIYFPNPTKTADIGDTIDLELRQGWVEAFPRIRWKHNGEPVPSWDDKLKVTIQSVQSADAGIYECHCHGKTYTHYAVMKLIVRKCKKFLYGEKCDKKCPSCYNGGVCHDLLGICVCPPGFSGKNCEVACGENQFGVDCSKSCPLSYCKENIFCMPDPYGCSCAPGLRSLFCNVPCEAGWYGADCKEPCHCLNGPRSCNMYTGACLDGCSPGWTGPSCQIKV